MQVIPFDNSMASHEKSKYWSEKNGDVTPDQVYKSSGKKYWFDCPDCEHCFEIRASCVSIGNWCIYCAGKKLCTTEGCNFCVKRSFASSEKAKYWSRDKNGDVTPRQVTKSSQKKFWFDCECGHAFEDTLSHVTNSGRWCGYCSSKKICESDECQICFQKSFASHEKVIHWNKKKNGDMTPRELFKSSNTKCWFDCTTCSHSFESSLSHVVNEGTWCPFCSSQVLCRDSNCDFCFKKSFASSEKASHWDNFLNGKTPREVFKSSGKLWHFDCDCGHSFQSKLNLVKKGRWCPFCANRQLCLLKDCSVCYEKSFASSELSSCWNPSNKMTPRQVFKSAGQKHTFDCKKCNHSFEATLDSVSKGSWCPFCQNKLCDSENCTYCFARSFASQPRAVFWSNRNDVAPRSVTITANRNFYFDCGDCGNEFEAMLGNVKKGHWCPKCKRKGERKLYEFLKTIFPNIISEFKQEWCKNKTYLPFDFCIPGLKILVELDGNQHFVQTLDWKSPEETRTRDKYKQKCANQNGYSMIRLLQKNVWEDRYDWKTELVDMINEVAKCQTVENRYMCKRNEYEHHMSDSDEESVTTIAIC